MAASIGAARRLRGKDALPVMAALCLHLAFVLFVMTWKPPPIGKPAAQTELFLISSGALGMTPQPPHPPMASLSQTRPKASPPPPAPSIRAADPGRSPKRDVSLPSTGEAALAALIAAGPVASTDLSAAPVALQSPGPPAAPPAAPSGSAKTCQILESLQANLAASQEVHGALALIPQTSRSISNATLLWNGRWLEIDAINRTSLLEPIKRIVEEDVQASPLACRAEMNHGPRLILVQEPHTTFVLAFGSGDWRWIDVLDTPSPSGLK